MKSMIILAACAATLLTGCPQPPPQGGGVGSPTPRRVYSQLPAGCKACWHDPIMEQCDCEAVSGTTWNLEAAKERLADRHPGATITTPGCE